MYGFIETHSLLYSVELMCRVLRVSRSAYYHWKQQKAGITDKKKKAVAQQVISVFKEHRRRYGVRRVAAELKANNVSAGAYKVRKVLKEHGLKAIQPRSFIPKTTNSAILIPLVPTCCWSALCP